MQVSLCRLRLGQRLAAEQMPKQQHHVAHGDAAVQVHIALCLSLPGLRHHPGIGIHDQTQHFNGVSEVDVVPVIHHAVPDLFVPVCILAVLRRHQERCGETEVVIVCGGLSLQRIACHDLPRVAAGLFLNEPVQRIHALSRRRIVLRIHADAPRDTAAVIAVLSVGHILQIVFRRRLVTAFAVGNEKVREQSRAVFVHHAVNDGVGAVIDFCPAVVPGDRRKHRQILQDKVGCPGRTVVFAVGALPISPVAQAQRPGLLVHFIGHDIPDHSLSHGGVVVAAAAAPNLVRQEQGIGDVHVSVRSRVCAVRLRQRLSVVALLPRHQMQSDLAGVRLVIPHHAVWHPGHSPPWKRRSASRSRAPRKLSPAQARRRCRYPRCSTHSIGSRLSHRDSAAHISTSIPGRMRSCRLSCP